MAGLCVRSLGDRVPRGRLRDKCLKASRFLSMQEAGSKIEALGVGRRPEHGEPQFTP
jgi:hypothetical protein